jgi:hypothetical protein
MIFADFECRSGHVTEVLVHWKQKKITCRCGKTAKRIISVSGQYAGNQDAPWIKSVLDVVDRESTNKHTREFIRNPNRKNYHAWLKGEGIKPVDYTEHGGPPTYKNPPLDMTNHHKEVIRRAMERRRIEI